MTARVVPLALTILAVSVLVGSGLAGLAEAPSNDPCSDFRHLPEGSSSSGELELWPLGLRCDYYVGSRHARTEFLGPSSAESWAWLAAAAIIASLALLKRDSAPARGAAGAATVLALAGAGWQFAGVNLAFSASLVFGPPLALALDHLLRPAATRSIRDSLRVAISVAILAFCTMFGVILAPAPAIVTCVLAAAVASTVVVRRQRPRPA